jgi:hypothetical protein
MVAYRVNFYLYLYHLGSIFQKSKSMNFETPQKIIVRVGRAAALETNLLLT